MKSIVKLGLTTMIIAFCVVSVKSNAQTTNYQVYSLFVMNIAKYSAWPPSTADFHITVFGKSKAYEEFVKIAATKTINGAVIRVVQTDKIEEIGTPQILYLSDGKSASLNEILQFIQNKAVMIIAEREGLYKKGAGFSFVLTDNNMLRFDINNTELEKRQIKVSKNLSSLANAVQ